MSTNSRKCPIPWELLGQVPQSLYPTPFILLVFCTPLGKSPMMCIRRQHFQTLWTVAFKKLPPANNLFTKFPAQRERERERCVCIYASSENQEHCFVCFSLVFTQKLRRVSNIYIPLLQSPANVKGTAITFKSVLKSP